MKRKLTTLLAALFLAALTLNAQPQQAIEIRKDANFLGLTPPTPIAITGFSGEVASVLNFDLSVMGFINVPPEQANFVLSGSNNGAVQAQLSLGSMNKTNVGTAISGTRTVLFSKKYEGGTLRAQAHKLADDVVLKITGVNGIAEVNGQASRIAFKASRGDTSEIYISDFDGHNAQPATADGSLVAAPCWVPKQFAIYYTTYKPGHPHIYYQDLKTTDRKPIANNAGDNFSPAVSPDGSKVAMILDKDGSTDLYVCDSTGQNLRRLTHTREDESSPCWSPDGRWICYASKVNERRALSKVSVNGGPSTVISTSGVSSPSEPDWSPDNQWIVFTSQTGGGFDICVVPAQGGTATRLVAGEDPCWAPNSRTVIFMRRNGANRGLSLLDVPTKQVKDVSRVSGNNSQPSWAK